MANQKNRKRTAPKDPKYSLGLLLPIIAVLTVIPLITYMHNYNTNLGQFEWYSSYTEAVDFFLYYKMVWIIVVCILMLFCLVYLFFAEEQKPIWIKNMIPLAVYCGLSLLSAIFSKYSYFSFRGIYEQFESVWVLIGYGIIVYYAFYIMHSESAVKRTLNWFVAGITVMAGLGLTQVFKRDFFRTDLGQDLMTPATYNYKEAPLIFNFELGRPYLSLYNPNYVGFYAALVLPILVILIFASKKLWQRLAYGALIASVLLILFASQSRAGIVALVFSLFVMLLCMRKVFVKNWKIGIAAVAVVAVAFLVVNKINDNILTSRLQGMFQSAPEYHPLKEIQTNDDNVTIVYQSQERNQAEGKLTDADSLIFQVKQDSAGNDNFTLTDGTGQEVSYTLSEDNTNYVIQDARFPFTFASVRSDGFNGFNVTIDGYVWTFSNLMKADDNTYYCRGGGSSLMKLAKITDTVPYLEDHYMLANKRGYIWARTIPLLKKYILLGSGPDTFIIAYPNNDLVGMYNSAHINEIITKPHCMYLQVGVQTGVLSLIALLIFFGWYLIDSLLIYWKSNYKDYLSFVGVGIFTAVIGYLILCLTNDSCVAISPIFFALLGIGMGINHKLRLEMPKPEMIPAKAGEQEVPKKESASAKPSGQEVPTKESASDKPSGQEVSTKETAPAEKQSNQMQKQPQGKSNSSQGSKNQKKKKKSGKKKR